MSVSATPAAPVVLVILDGWGLAPPGPGNAVTLAETPVFDRLWEAYPTTTLAASGEAVGLPEGQMGNSEVGHLNLGAGFVVYQWITRIDRAIADGSLAASPVLRDAFAEVLRTGSRLHLIGLIGDGGVHAHQRHLDALIAVAADAGIGDPLVHAITDGRDSSPSAGRGAIARLEATLAALGSGRIATVSGRYHAMDRDHRWDRTRVAYDAIVRGIGPSAPTAEAAIASAYLAGITDEFISPVIIGKGDAPYPGIGPHDVVVWFNFRADRARQLTEAMVSPTFDGFDRGDTEPLRRVITLTRYHANFESDGVTVVFPPEDVDVPLARVVSDAGLGQAHIAETEKYAHVTFFLNGGREEPFPGEVRAMVASPKVQTYDLAPAMSAAGGAAAAIAAIRSGENRFVVVNFANGDMVGHTGDLAATITAIETVDACLGQVVEATLAAGGSVVVTADHGNAEEMIDQVTAEPMTAHTTNPVPLVLVVPDGSPHRHATLRGGGVLSAVAPSVLGLLGLTVPAAMDQSSLVREPSPGSG
ncbi:MAG: 2,3-bisphosphoglycerate-independent phosphoglycerate mutase [uncultured Thermomicrobiales bacterium]|uniref:2,3-bisphosphoglycerate-independent phosphoglycerate mutase n=1 Tax=uncultured Thermomicrobiales bacterium TaxID=1645740 RepID=A0A6J4U8M5_9BACT|nr:MAG: 2,3-bisphosphoglycerate-independent phosphoglycerate mutase [uncultured Thermomicrobiales bacterium]